MSLSIKNPNNFMTLLQTEIISLCKQACSPWISLERKELEVFETGRKINYDLKKLVEEKSNKFEVINVISSFQPIGSEVKGVTKNYVFLLGLLGGILVILLLLLIKLNSYLKNYRK